MKIAELYASLGFQLSGSSLADLTAFESVLNNIASAADKAVASLKQLQGIGIKSIKIINPAANAPVGTPASKVPATAPAGTAVILPASPPAGAPPPHSFGSQVFGGLSKQFPLLKFLGAATALTAGIALLAMGVKKIISGFVEMARSSLKASVETDKFTTATGASRQEMRQLEQFAATAGINADVMTDAVKQFQQTAVEMKYGEKSYEGYAFNNISANQPFFQILKQFMEKTAGLSPAEAAFRGSKIGIGPELIYALRSSGAKLGKAFDTSLLPSDEDYKNIREAARAGSELSFSFKLLGDRITADISPALEKLATGLTWLTDKLFTAANPNRSASSVGASFMAGQLMGFNLGAGRQAPITQNNTYHINESTNPQKTQSLIEATHQLFISDTYNQAAAYPGQSR
jgi:hypothetical protein